MAITPNSTVQLYRGMQLPRDMSHTWSYADIGEQEYQFTERYPPAYTYTNLSYVRQGAAAYQVTAPDTIRVNTPPGADTADVLSTINYLRFKNTNYLDKWFYAFVDIVTYVNDNCADIHFTIDPLQTYYFDYEYLPCYMERCHQNSKQSNYVPEDITAVRQLVNYEIIGAENVALADGTYVSDMQYIISAYQTNVGGAEYSAGSVINGAYYTPLIYRVINISDFKSIENICEGMHATLDLWSKNINIVGINAIPREWGINVFSPQFTHIENAGTIRETKWYSVPTDLGSITTSIKVSDLTKLSFNPNKGPNLPYIPVNSKLNNFPFSLFRLKILGGDEVAYYPEFISRDSEEPQIDVTLVFFPALMLLVSNNPYLLNKYNPQQVVANTLEQIPWAADSHAEWYKQNNIINIGKGLQSAILNAAGIPAVGGIMAGFENIQSYLTPDKYMANNVNFDIAKNGVGIMWYLETVSAYDAKRIDDYFTRYGYAQKAIMLPDRRVRPKWNYIKTNNCVIKPIGDGIPADMIDQIVRVHNNGITFWDSTMDISDYSKPRNNLNN